MNPILPSFFITKGLTFTTMDVSVQILDTISSFDMTLLLTVQFDFCVWHSSLCLLKKLICNLPCCIHYPEHARLTWRRLFQAWYLLLRGAQIFLNSKMSENISKQNMGRSSLPQLWKYILIVAYIALWALSVSLSLSLLWCGHFQQLQKQSLSTEHYQLI